MAISLPDYESQIIIYELSGIIVEMFIPSGFFQADQSCLFTRIVLIANFIPLQLICSDLDVDVLDE